MKKLDHRIAAATLALTVAWQTSFAADPAPKGISGTYVMVGNVGTILEVKAENGQYRLELSGGGMASAGAAVAADCLIAGQGKLKGNRLAAAFSAVDTDTFSYSATQAKTEDRKLKVVFGPSKAKVIRADTLGYCGLAAEFIGEYRRKSGK